MRPQRQQPTWLRRPQDSPGKNTGVGCHFLLQCMKAKSESEVAQSCPTPSDPMDRSPPGSSVHGIFQARANNWGLTNEWTWLLHYIFLAIYWNKAWLYLKCLFGTSLVVQWLGLGLPMQGVRVPSLVRELRPHMQRQSIKHRNKQTKKNIKQKHYCNKFNKDFKNSPHLKKKKKLRKKCLKVVKQIIWTWQWHISL